MQVESNPNSHRDLWDAVWSDFCPHTQIPSHIIILPCFLDSRLTTLASFHSSNKPRVFLIQGLCCCYLLCVDQSLLQHGFAGMPRSTSCHLLRGSSPAKQKFIPTQRYLPHCTPTIQMSVIGLFAYFFLVCLPFAIRWVPQWRQWPGLLAYGSISYAWNSAFRRTDAQ